MRSAVESRLRVDSLMRLWLSRVGSPSPKQIREHYQNNLDAFWSPELVRASQIVKNVHEGDDAAAIEQTMRHVRSLLSAGADFGAMAAEYSDCPEGRGDLGYFPRGVMVEEFDAIVFTCPVGELTDVFRTRFGYHLAIVWERRPEGIRSFDEMREEIGNALLRERRDREVGSRLAALRARAVIRKVHIPS
jgi:parvulin-like peptidyl-prolyl isomerase